MDKRWRPSVTVAAVIEKDGRFLLIEEETSHGLRLNTPAGRVLWAKPERAIKKDPVYAK